MFYNNNDGVYASLTVNSNNTGKIVLFYNYGFDTDEWSIKTVKNFPEYSWTVDGLNVFPLYPEEAGVSGVGVLSDNNRKLTIVIPNIPNIFELTVGSFVKQFSIGLLLEDKGSKGKSLKIDDCKLIVEDRSWFLNDVNNQGFCRGSFVKDGYVVGYATAGWVEFGDAVWEENDGSLYLDSGIRRLVFDRFYFFDFIDPCSLTFFGDMGDGNIFSFDLFFDGSFFRKD